MKYKRICNWCGKEHETDDIDLDYCSLECYRADEEYHLRDIEFQIEDGSY